MEQEPKPTRSIKFFAIGGNVCCVPIPMEEQRASGLVLPGNMKERPHRARVVSVGAGGVRPDGERYPMDVEVGDVVLHMAYSGSLTELNEQPVLLLRLDEILGIIREFNTEADELDAAVADGARPLKAGYLVPPPPSEHIPDMDELRRMAGLDFEAADPQPANEADEEPSKVVLD